MYQKWAKFTKTCTRHIIEDVQKFFQTMGVIRSLSWLLRDLIRKWMYQWKREFILVQQNRPPKWKTKKHFSPTNILQWRRSSIQQKQYHRNIGRPRRLVLLTNKKNVTVNVAMFLFLERWRAKISKVFTWKTRLKSP